MGEAAGLLVVAALRRGRQARLVQNVARTMLEKTIPKVGESQTAAVARCLRITGIWMCVAEGVPLASCPCFEALVISHTEQWISDELTGRMTCLRSSPTQAK